MNKRNTIIMIVLFFIGLLTLFYPTLSNYYNEKNTDENTAKYLCRLDGDGLTVIKKYFCQ